MDRSVPVSGDEVLDVHLVMAEFQGGLTELIDLNQVGQPGPGRGWMSRAHPVESVSAAPE